MSDENPRNKLVNDPEWQRVRKSLLGQWSTKANWCCLQLLKYLGTSSKASNDKVKIVMNYLTGTGFRTGRISHPCIKKIRLLLSKEIKNRKSKGTW